LFSGRFDRMEVDPVCGMEVDPDSAAAQSEHEGKLFYFCSPTCKQKFEKEPDLYTTE